MAQRTRQRREVIYKRVERPAPQPVRKAPRDRNVVKPDSRANRSLLWRVIALMCVCGVAMFIPLIVQLYKLQIQEHDFYKELGVQNQTRDVSVAAGRGSILDRNGDVMAMSATVYNLILSPNVNETIVDYLVGDLGLDEERVRSNLTKTKMQYLEMMWEISEEDAKEIREFIQEHRLATALYL